MDLNDIRKSNIVWTVSGDYEYMPILNLFDKYDDEKMDYYRMLLLGYVYKSINMNQLLDFIAIRLPKIQSKNEFLKLIEIFLDDCYGKALIKERPGAEEYRSYFINNIIRRNHNLLKEESKEFTLEREIEYIYYSRINGHFVETNNGIFNLVEYSHSKRNKFSTEDLIKSINDIYLKYFFINAQEDKSEDLQLKSEKKEDKDKIFKINEEKSRLSLKMMKKHVKSMKDEDSIGLFTVESAEFTKNIEDYEELINDVEGMENANGNGKTEDEVRTMVETRYGVSGVSSFMTTSLENELCVGIHNGVKLHLTYGDFKEGNYDKYFFNSINRMREQSMEYYKDNELSFRRSINQLKSILLKKIKFENEEEILNTNSGTLNVSKLWRSRFLNEDKIFNKVLKNDVGSLSVDILLDSSASQMEREEMVSSQAYIIAEALTSLNIPTRVIGFCNFFNYLIMTQYRDYNDSQRFNKNIFSYKASGSNRDGLAIKVISRLMDNTDYEKKVLIVLSDGKPNDKIDIGVYNFYDINAVNYVDDEAVKDTAQEIFNLKLRQRNVLGVFTGLDKDLEQEKKIYGKDFAYIRDINRFSQIIGFYLENLFD